MVHWGPITPEQKKIWPVIEKLPAMKHFIGGAVFGTGFVINEPKEVNMDEIDEKFRVIVEENIPIYEKLRQHKLKPVETL